MYRKTILGAAAWILLAGGIFAQAPRLPLYESHPSKLQNESVPSRTAADPLFHPNDRVLPLSRLQNESVLSNPAPTLWIRPYDLDTLWRLEIMAAQQRDLERNYFRRIAVFGIVDGDSTGGIQSARDYSHEENRRLRKFTNPATLGIQIDSTGEPYMFRPSLSTAR